MENIKNFTVQQNKPLNSLKKLNLQSTIKYNHSTKFKFKTNEILTMETILIITKKEMFSGSSRNYIRNKVRKLFIYIYICV